MYQYAGSRGPFVEPDWTRLPGYRTVSRAQWEDARWQRMKSVRTAAQLKEVFGRHLSDGLAADIVRDQERLGTMSLLVPPHMLNTMDERDLEQDPIRRYMLPATSDRRVEFPSHPYASRDSLGESAMWAAEGLTHRYPTKVLIEATTTCPQYCGHCTRMDLVGPDTLAVTKTRFQLRPLDRFDAMLDYVRQTASIRDVVVSGGDIANVGIEALEGLVSRLIDIPHVRDIRLASKALINLPQHFLQPQVMAAFERMGRHAQNHRVALSLHTHANHARELTPRVVQAVDHLFACGFRDVRNQGVLLRGVNATAADLLDLCFVLADHVRITPYYFFMCDLVPNAEHWRLALWEAQQLQEQMLGYLPGYATPRLVCDVAYAGKRWVHQVTRYDRERGISTWAKSYRTHIESEDVDLSTREYYYYDPIHTLPECGQQWWRSKSQATA